MAVGNYLLASGFSEVSLGLFLGKLQTTQKTNKIAQLVRSHPLRCRLTVSHTIVLFTFSKWLGDKTIKQYIESEGEALQGLV